MRRVLSIAVAAVVCTALTGCASVYRMRPIMVSGADTQRWIDGDAAVMLAARHPDVAVGPSQCPFLLNLTAGHTEQCTIPVNGAPFRIRVAFDDDGSYVVRGVDALVEQSSAQRQIAQSLQLRYGVPFTVRCDGPAVRVLPIGQPFACGISAPTIWADRDEAHAIDRDGTVTPDDLPSGDTALARAFGIEIADRKHGYADLDGPPVERYIREQIGGITSHADLVRYRLIRAVGCPKRVFVSPEREERCSVRLGTTTAFATVRFTEGEGLWFKLPSVAVVPALRELATRYFAVKDRQQGNFAPIRIDCGRADVVTVDDGGFIPCTMSAGEYGDRFAFDIGDGTGSVTLREL